MSEAKNCAPSLVQVFGQRFVRSQNRSYFDSSILPGPDLPEQNQASESPRKSCIISRDSWPYGYWYSWMSLMISYSTIMTAFFLAYDSPGNFMVYIDRIVWLMFVVDLGLEFFVDFKDEDDTVVESLSEIAFTYLRGWFVLDLIAVIPLSEFGYAEAEYYLRMLRILKVKRGLSLFDGSFIGPIILAVAKPKVPADRHRLSIYIRYLISFIQIFAALIFTTYVLGAFFFWWAEATENVSNPWNKHFSDFFTMSNPTPLQEMLRSWYFLVTTLSTVGYGDFYATNMLEKVMLIFILLIGISQFSLIVGQFNGLVAEFDKMNDKDTNMDDLIAWMASIDAVQNHIPAALRAKITHHFEYYWEHDRLRDLALPWSAAETAEELVNHQDEYLTMLPKGHKEAILNHLFADFGVKFSIFFKKNNEFRMDLTPYFQPRLFQPNNYIIRKGKLIEEIIFLIKGEVACGVKSAKSFKPVIFYKNSAIIGDVEALDSGVAMASYKAIGAAPVHCFALPVKPVRILLAEKYKQLGTQLQVQHKMKQTYILTSLAKYMKPAEKEERSAFFSEFTVKVLDKKKDSADHPVRSEVDVQGKERELETLRKELLELRLHSEKQRSTLLWTLLETAA